MLGGRVRLNMLLLNGPAKKMAAEIECYAQTAKRIAAMGLADAVLEAVEATRHRFPPTAAPVADARDTSRPAKPAADFTQPVAEPVLEQRGSFAERLSAAGPSPVEAIPSMSERIFGRRKVI